MHHPDPNEKSRQQRMVKKDAVMRRLLAATLSVSSLWQLMPLSVTAQSTPLTAAGAAINNTATGTYQDPNNPGVNINTTSNTVTATVAEVAGISNVGSGFNDLNGGSITTNDAINAAFLITNTGNDFTAFHIPATAADLGLTGVTLGTTTSNALPASQLAAGVYATEINGVVLTVPIKLDPTGNTNDAAFITAVQTTGGYAAFNGYINANSGIKVIVPVTVTETIAGNPVTVRLGQTGSNIFTNPDSQNQPDSGVEPPTTGGTDPLSAANEVYTINPGPGIGIAGTPVNGVREAAATLTAPLATQVNNLALATVLKTLSAYSQSGTPLVLTDDTLTYDLALRVENSPPANTTGITPAPLRGTAISVDSGAGAVTVTKILISDAVPQYTELDTSFAPTLPTGWTRVYTTSPTGTNPVLAAWTTTAPAANTITRVGFIADGPITPGTTVQGFQLRVTAKTIPTVGAQIANIAQVIGQTNTGAPSATNPLVYDESGDQNPNNYESGAAPTITSPANIPTGVANPSVDQTDTNNNNTGTGPGGEDNVYNIIPPGSILNGPQGQPGAVGPDGTNNTDFVNKSAVDVPAGATTGSAYDPAPITYTNTVQNPNTTKQDNVTLEPISATLAAKAVNNTTTPTAAQVQAFDLTNLPNHLALPNGTTVLISYGGRGAIYTLTAGEFVLTSSGTTTNTVTSGVVTNVTGGTGDATAAPVIIPTLPANTSADYNVKIDLPAGSLVTQGYSVPIVAYVNSNTGDGSTFKTTGTKLAEDNPFNIKSDRVYTGYLDLLKESRVLTPAGSPALPTNSTDGTFSITPKKPAPGNILEYRITFKNISTANSGSGNVVLNANNIVITEDGTTGGPTGNTNNWATTTLNVPSTAANDSTTTAAGALITFFNGTSSAQTTDLAITKYISNIPTLGPTLSGTFGFQRKVK